MEVCAAGLRRLRGGFLLSLTDGPKSTIEKNPNKETLLRSLSPNVRFLCSGYMHVAQREPLNRRH